MLPEPPTSKGKAPFSVLGTEPRIPHCLPVRLSWPIHSHRPLGGAHTRPPHPVSTLRLNVCHGSPHHQKWPKPLNPVVPVFAVTETSGPLRPCNSYPGCMSLSTPTTSLLSKGSSSFPASMVGVAWVSVFGPLLIIDAWPRQRLPQQTFHLNLNPTNSQMCTYFWL